MTIVLPKYPKVLSINWLSTAAQSALACITADGRGGEPDKYFLKVRNQSSTIPYIFLTALGKLVRPW